MRLRLPLAVALTAAACAPVPKVVLPTRPLAFADYFVDRTLRVDYHHTGNASSESFALDELYDQGAWAGGLRDLLGPLENGRQAVKVYDAATGLLLFARAYDSIFGEYRTTTPAEKGELRTFHESVLVPLPKRPVRLALEVRGKDRRLHERFSVVIDPNDDRVRRVALDEGARVVVAHQSGDPHTRVDVAILGEGYTAAEEEKFRRDLARFTAVLFSVDPFKRLKDRFNVRGVWRPSQESGASAPSWGEHRNTALRAGFDSLGSERYVLTEDNRALRALAAHVPYDAIVVMVNHPRYGGGGIYNLYSTFTTDNQWSDYIFVHEFGHSFGGLADEYYSSSTAYNDFYPKGVEPSEPNITAHPLQLKWRDLVTPATQTPTPWEKAAYDVFDSAYQKKRNAMNKQLAALMKKRAPKPEIQKMVDLSEALSRDNRVESDAFLAKSKFVGQVGAFQGAGYSNRLYRPMLQCIMFNRGLRPFCRVCERAIARAVEQMTGAAGAPASRDLQRARND